MKITTTNFDFNHYENVKVESQLNGIYVLPNIDVFNKIIIDGVELTAVYQTACSFLNEDYNSPSNMLELSQGGGADEVLVKLNDLTEADILNEDISEIIELLENKLNKRVTRKNILELYTALNENLPQVTDFVSLELADYEEVECVDGSILLV